MAANAIMKVVNNITNSWSAVTGATKYHLRISRDYDFTTIEVQNTNITVLSTPICTNVISSGSYKYYYQWRSYISTWQPWTQVQSFEKMGSGTELTITNGKWMMFESSERSTYTLSFTSAPDYEYINDQLARTAERNLAGTLLSEFYTTKGKLILDFGENNTLSEAEKRQVERYYSLTSGNIYVACAIYDGSLNYFRHLWKVHFTTAPTIKHLPGNTSRYIMHLELEER